MPIKKRPRLAPTEEWQQLDLLITDRAQRTYEVMRPLAGRIRHQVTRFAGPSSCVRRDLWASI